MKLSRLVEVVKLIFPDSIDFSSTSENTHIRNALSRGSELEIWRI